MMDPNIEKLINCELNGNPNDARIGLILLREQIYPNIPEEIKRYLWSNVAHDIIKEYFHDNLDSKAIEGCDAWTLKWKENDT